jgi:hypothetical protein
MARDATGGGDDRRRLRRRLVAMICRRCVRRAGGDDEDLGKRVTKRLRRRSGDDDVMVADISCLGVCPRDAVTVVLAGDLAEPGARVRLVPADKPEKRAARLVARALADG